METSGDQTRESRRVQQAAEELFTDRTHWVGRTARTPFEPSGLVRIIEVEPIDPLTGRQTCRVEFLDDHPHGYAKGTVGRYFVEQLHIVE